MNHDTNNAQNPNRPVDAQNMGRTGSRGNTADARKDGGNEKAIVSDKAGRGENIKGRESDIVDALTFENLSYFRPARREFTDCDIETIYNHYLEVIKEVFGIRVRNFVDKDKLKIRVQTLVIENLTLLEVVRFINRYQDEISD